MRKRQRMITIAALALALSHGQVALAATEQGDAGELLATAQDLTAEAVTSVSGSFASRSDVDVYEVCLTGGGSFSASTVGGSGLDTQLFLFNEHGRGVYGNDDTNGVRQSRLPARHALTPNARGTYFLAVSQYNRDPQSALGPIFPSTLTGVVGPSERGAGHPVAGWGGVLGSAPGPYTVSVEGAEACQIPDLTAPVVDLRSPGDDLRVEVGTAIEVDFSCSDEGGSELASCVGSVADGAWLDTSSVGSRSVTVAARDNAGNETVVTHDVEVVDETPPSILLSSPSDGAEYLLGETVLADYSCSDAGALVTLCSGDVPNGSAIDTSSPGPASFTVNALDAAGNSATQTVGYRVAYDFSGFLAPVENPPGLNRWLAGRPVPVRFSLDGDHGLDAVEGIEVAEVDCGAGEGPTAGEPARLVKGVGVPYRSRLDRYSFLWRSARSWAGECRRLLVKLDDGSVQRADFAFVARGSELRGEDD